MSDFYNKYPYTDFHELNLDWVIERVKKLTEDWAATLEEWNSTEEQWQELYNYVHDYFDNLDVQEEINNKINAMIADGTFVTITTPVIEAKVASMMPATVASQIGDTVASQIGATVAGQIGATVASQIDTAIIPPVDSWLSNHITQPTTPVIDNTLSIPGAGADALKTGQLAASVYSSSSTYRVNNYCLHNGTVFRCTTAVTTPETFDNSKWTVVRLANDVETLLNTTLENNLTLALGPDAPNVLNDLNNAKRNSIYIFMLSDFSTQAPANLPSSFSDNKFLVITLSNEYSGTSYYYNQYLAYSETGKIIAHRTNNNGTWSSWTVNDELPVNIKKQVAFTTDISNVITDLNSALDNTLYKIMASDASQLPSNVPSDCPLNIYVFTIKQKIESNNTYTMQYIFNQNLKLLFRRQNYNGWGSWIKISYDIIVDAAGGGNYTSLTAAVANAHNGDIIYVKKGTYDNEKVKAWNKNITIIGEDRYQTIIKNGDNDYYNPPIEASIGHLENLTFIQYDGQSGAIHPGSPSAGYALHIEDNSLTNASLTVRNCTFKSDMNHGVGIGLRPGCYLEFDDCEMHSHDKSGLFMHDCATGAVGVQTINVKNCIITTDDQYSATFNSLRYEGTTVYIGSEYNIFANSAGTIPEIKAENKDGYGTGTTVGDFMNLVNFYKMKTNYGSNVSDVNYTPI